MLEFITNFDNLFVFSFFNKNKLFLQCKIYFYNLNNSL